MSRFIFDLTDEDREALEAIRKNRGHRSQAETLRELVRQAGSHQWSADEVAAMKAKPQPPLVINRIEPPAPFKTRLKGEWKAP